MPDPHAAADRNLLFGVLALQMDFIGRDALIAAMNTWVLDKARPLGQILVEGAALRAGDRDLLEAMVRRHLELHGDDAERSLASLSAVGSVQKELAQIADADLHASLALVSAAAAAEQATTVGRPTSAGLRFRILRPHARGGLGEVFVARDEELHREVALKEIQERHADQPDSRARFLLEAEITGGLEHPGIVPVYGLGAYADGRPFYAMRFIRGDSLKDAIARFHRADGPGRDVGERTLALRELLGRFIDVCNAIAYAHSRGVLHRDLKPGNVMLGRYGETLVVDWGLAKAVGRPEGAASTEEGALRPTAASDSAPTQLGSAIGTPAYMSPEQAAGRLDQLGPASDVYSLGATLYTLLTGQAPFTKDAEGAVLQKVQRGEFAPPRQVHGCVPAALEAVCLKAMALRPQERYPSPQALADDLEHWLADEPVVAYREPVAVRLGRWRRRHRALVAGVTAAALALVVMGAIGVFWLVQQAAELRRGVEAALDRAAALQQQARWAEAGAVLEQADARLGEGGPDDLRQRVAQARADLALVRRLDAAHLKAATLVEGQLDFAGTERDYAAAFRQAQLGRLGDEMAVVAARVRASAVKAQLVAALDDWAYLTRSESRRAWLLAVARGADPDPWRDRFRDPKLWRDRQALERLARQAAVAQWSPQLVTALARVLAVQGIDAVPLLTAAQARHPQDFWLNFELGSALQMRKQDGEAVGYYRAALALRPHTSAVYNNLGNALKAKGRLDGAMACYHQALAIDPKFAPAHYNLGIALKAKGRLDGAMACYHQALAIDPKFAPAHYNLGIALRKKGDVDGAIASYRKALALDPKLAPAHNNLGAALQAKGQLDRAIACFEKALAIDPKDAKAHHNLGNALREKGELDRAIACFQKALAIDPKFAGAHNNLGLALRDRGQLEQAIACLQKALALDPKLAQAHYNLGKILADKGQLDRASACFRQALALDPKLAQAHNNLGNALDAKGQLDRAIACYRRALAIDPKLAPAHYNLGNALQAKGDQDGAIACYQKALALDPKYAMAHNNLGAALAAKGQLDEAIGCFQKALALDPKFAPAHGALGQALLLQGRFRAARDSTRRCLQLLPQSHPLRRFGSQQLRQCERLLALEARLPTLLQGKAQPASPTECLEYAGLCHLKKFYPAAVRFYVEAFAADPKLVDRLAAGHRYNAACSAALAAASQGPDASQLDTRERARLRKQALDWLRADLALWSKLLETGQPPARAAAQQTLQHWQRDAALAGIRDAAWLVNLPADELRACRKLWADVDQLLKRAGEPK
jgi:tetratricopeptide (TPR) repeat protein/tRNA A-37 threonylcarbamoyl transferase component Bud32